MTDELIRKRNEVMNVAWKALDAAWPDRKSDNFVQTMDWAVHEIAAIAAEMASKHENRVEQSRTYRHLGDLYADLQPAMGDQILLQAKKAYETAEALLEGETDELERAKLRFNFANTLRLIDPNNIPNLQAAKQRLLAARTYFASHAPEDLQQIDAAMRSVDSLLLLAPLANTVREKTEEMTELQNELHSGGDVIKLARKMHELMSSDGGPAGIAARLQATIQALPPDTKKDMRFAEVEETMQDVTDSILRGGSVDANQQKALSLLTERLKSETGVASERAETLANVLREFGNILEMDEKDIPSSLSKVQKMRDFPATLLEIAHYPSYGLPRPPAGSRAAEMIEQSWQLRRYLLEEMNRAEKGEEESKECLELNIRASAVDRRIYEAGSDDAAAAAVKQEELLPLTLAVRNFSARLHTMPAHPIWGGSKMAVDTNTAFLSDPSTASAWLQRAVRRAGLRVLPEPTGQAYADARWNQLQKPWWQYST